LAKKIVFWYGNELSDVSFTFAGELFRWPVFEMFTATFTGVGKADFEKCPDALSQGEAVAHT